MNFSVAEMAAWPWNVLVLVWLFGWFRRKRAASAPNLALQIPTTALLALGFLLLFKSDWFGLGARLTPKTLAFDAAGLALDVAGVAFAIWARVALGRNWSGVIMAVKDEHQLIQSGPYAIVRHPIYTGLLVAMLGTALTFGTRGAYLGFAVAAIALLIRIPFEEALMRQHFGAAHESYRRRTKRLVPFVW